VFEQSMGEDCVETLVLKWKVIDALFAKFDVEALAFSQLVRFRELRIFNIDSRHEPWGTLRAKPNVIVPGPQPASSTLQPGFS
jgi:hypothetical protein